MRVTECQQELAADSVVLRLHGVEYAEADGEEPSGLFVGKKPQRAFGGTTGVGEGLLRDGRAC